MDVGSVKYPDSLRPEMIAPCGMNCGLCTRQFRSKDTCAGCRGNQESLPTYCTVCRIRNCDEFADGAAAFCFECARFPCPRLRRLDLRYRTKYGMSMIENLESIQANGLARFISTERKRWACPECGGVICVHKHECVYCGHARSQS